jgi:hypothetical protein
MPPPPGIRKLLKVSVIAVIVGVLGQLLSDAVIFLASHRLQTVQEAKIAALNQQVAPRRLTVDQQKMLSATLAKFPGQTVFVESYGKEVESFVLGTQILNAAADAGLPEKNELMTVDAISGVLTGMCISGTNAEIIAATKAAFSSFHMALCSKLGDPGAFSTVVPADAPFPLRIFVGVKPLPTAP